MLELRIMTGISQGAAFPLVDDELLIGSSDDADIVLLDPLIQGHHCRLKKEDDQWVLSAEQGKIIDNKGQKVEVIENLSLSNAFALNQTWMMVAEVDTPWEDNETPREQIFAPSNTDVPSKKSRKVQITTFVLGFITAVAITVTSTWASFNNPSNKTVSYKSQNNDGTSNENVLQTLQNTEQHKSSIQDNPYLPVLKDRQEVADQLSSMLRQRELQNLINVNTDSKKVILTGQVSAADQSIVKRMLENFAAHFDTPISIVNKVSDHQAKLPFTIDQINGGKLASVILSNGQRLFIGDEVDGLRLVAVDENKVVFRGKQEYEISW